MPVFLRLRGGGMEDVFLTLNGRNKPGRQNEGGSFLRCPFCLFLSQRFAAFREACFFKCSGFMAFEGSCSKMVWPKLGASPSRMERGMTVLYSIWGRCRSTWSMTWRERLVRPSYMVISTPSCRMRGLAPLAQICAVTCRILASPSKPNHSHWRGVSTSSQAARAEVIKTPREGGVSMMQ